MAEFLFDVMTQFGCIFQLTCDNGSEFFGVTELLLQKYKVPVVRISAYNSRANGKIERTHQSYMDSIWKVCEGQVVEWPNWLNYALWANRVIAKRNMGFLPYYLLYRQHLLLPFDVEDCAFQVLDWPLVHFTPSLLASRAQQLVQKGELLSLASESNLVARKKVVDAYYQRHVE